jgi:hypothetical protein
VSVFWHITLHVHVTPTSTRDSLRPTTTAIKSHYHSCSAPFKTTTLNSHQNHLQPFTSINQKRIMGKKKQRVLSGPPSQLGRCAMYDRCGKKGIFGQELPCPDDQPARKVRSTFHSHPLIPRFSCILLLKFSLLPF